MDSCRVFCVLFVRSKTLEFIDIINSGIFSGQEFCVFSTTAWGIKAFSCALMFILKTLHNSLFTGVVHPKI